MEDCGVKAVGDDEGVGLGKVLVKPICSGGCSAGRVGNSGVGGSGNFGNEGVKNSGLGSTLMVFPMASTVGCGIGGCAL